MLRALILTSRYPSARAPYRGNFIERQCLALAARPGVSVQVAAPFPVPPEAALPAPQVETRRGLRVLRTGYHYDSGRRGDAPAAIAAALLAALADFGSGFDVVAGQFFWPEGPATVEIARALGIPCSIKGRGIDVEVGGHDAGAAAALLNAGGEADGLLAISADVRAAMIALGMPGERIEVHHSGIDRALFHLRDRPAAKAALKVEGPLLLTVGNLEAGKRPRLAIELLPDIRDATLILAGGGPEWETLHQAARDLGVAERVRCLGPVPHELLPILYSAADVTVHPSAAEGFANVRLESVACGTPVVTFATGGAAEILDRPEAGRIVADQPGAMLAAVRALLAAPPAPEAVAAAADRFSWERNSEELERHLRGLVEAPLPRSRPIRLAERGTGHKGPA